MTAAQLRAKSHAEQAMLHAFAGIAALDLADIIANFALHRFGAMATETMGERITRAARSGVQK